MNKNKIETLTSRERVRRAVAHEPVDRVPIDLGVHYSTGISGFAYLNLREYLGLEQHPAEIIDTFQFLARVEQDILERFHCDCMCFHPGFASEKLWNPRGNYQFRISDAIYPKLKEDGSWILTDINGNGGARMPNGGFFFDGGGFNTWVGSEGYVEAAARYTEQIYKETNYYTLYIGGISAYASQDIGWLMDFTEDPEEVSKRFERTHEHNINELNNMFNKIGKYIQGICIGCDLGTQIAPMMNPKLFDDYVAPWYYKLCKHLHENSDYKLFYHSCGAMEPFIKTLCDCGVDILNPVQISCPNMKPDVIKAKHGDRICFWGGGCDTQNVLGSGTPDEVKENVRCLMKDLAPNSGFVFNQVHNVMGNVPPENIVAMLDTAYEESFKYGDLV